MGLFDRLFGKKKTTEDAVEQPDLQPELTSEEPLLEEEQSWDELATSVEDFFTEEVVLETEEESQEAIDSQDDFVQAAVAEQVFTEEVVDRSPERDSDQETYEDETISEQAHAVVENFEEDLVQPEMAPLSNPDLIEVTEDATESATETLVTEDDVRDTERKAVEEETTAAVDGIPEAHVDFPQEEIILPEVLANQEIPISQEAVGEVYPTEADAYHEAGQETLVSDPEPFSVQADNLEESTDEKSPETVAHVPSSLERAMEILRDKEKRAAAVEEAEAKNREEARLAEERALEEARLAEEAQKAIQDETTQEKYDRSLKKTRTGFGAKLNAFFANFRSVDEEFFEDLEELLITSDVGVQVATRLTEELRQEAKLEKAKKPEDLRRVIIEKLVDIYEQDGNFDSEKIALQPGLTVMLFVGVNGVGKTTSIGKLAHKYKNEGKKVMLVAADTFRAGAVAQLAEWARRVGVDVVTGPEKSDPASVVYDGMERAVAEEVDILMIDTAGRLQNKDNLMAELEKIGRIIKRVLPDAPHETLLALDASTGQNALVQAKEFSKITPLTGLVLTKIDGTARGGVVLAIRQELDIPVKLIGFGEKIDDIGQFNSEDFMRGLLEGLV